MDCRTTLLVLMEAQLGIITRDCPDDSTVSPIPPSSDPLGRADPRCWGRDRASCYTRLNESITGTSTAASCGNESHCRWLAVRYERKCPETLAPPQLQLQERPALASRCHRCQARRRTFQPDLPDGRRSCLGEERRLATVHRYATVTWSGRAGFPGVHTSEWTRDVGCTPLLPPIVPPRLRLRSCLMGSCSDWRRR